MEFASNAAELLGVLAALAIADGRLKIADTHLQSARRIFEELQHTSAPGYFDVIENMGFVALGKGHQDEADELFVTATHLREACLGPGHPDVCLGKTNIGFYCQSWDDIDKAEKLIKDAIERVWPQCRDSHPFVAIAHCCLGTLVSEQDNRDTEAEMCFERATRICRGSLGATHWLSSAVTGRFLRTRLRLLSSSHGKKARPAD